MCGPQSPIGVSTPSKAWTRCTFRPERSRHMRHVEEREETAAGRKSRPARPSPARKHLAPRRRAGGYESARSSG